MPTLSVTSENGEDVVRYVATIDGSATKTKKSKKVTSVDEANDTITSQYGYTTIHGETGNGYGDAFDVQGKVVNVQKTGGTSNVTGQKSGESNKSNGSVLGSLGLGDLGTAEYAILGAIVGYVLLA